MLCHKCSVDISFFLHLRDRNNRCQSDGHMTDGCLSYIDLGSRICALELEKVPSEGS